MRVYLTSDVRLVSSFQEVQHAEKTMSHLWVDSPEQCDSEKLHDLICLADHRVQRLQELATF